MRSIVLSTLFLLGAVWSGVAVATSPPVLSSPPGAEQASEPTEWRRWWGGWVRLEANKHLSCLSDDGVNCFWRYKVAHPSDVAPSAVKPVMCGPTLLKTEWKITGYNDANDPHGERHWCRSAFATLYAKWEDYSVLGAPHWLAETPSGDLMCHSTDGKHCTTVNKGDTAPPPSGEVHPLVCGAHHRRMHGHDGYDTPGSWCRMPKIDDRFRDLPVKDGEWQEKLAAGWFSLIEPSVVARVKVPEGHSLTLRAMAQFAKPIQYPQKLEQAAMNLEVGERVRFYLGESAAEQMPLALGELSPAAGEVVVGMAVTEGKHGCFFGAKSSDERKGHFFSASNVIGSTAGLLDKANEPILFAASVPAFPKHSPVEWRANGGDQFKIDELLVLYARLVPVEGDPTGKKRWIRYLNDCAQ